MNVEIVLTIIGFSLLVYITYLIRKSNTKSKWNMANFNRRLPDNERRENYDSTRTERRKD